MPHRRLIRCGEHASKDGEGEPSAKAPAPRDEKTVPLLAVGRVRHRSAKGGSARPANTISPPAAGPATAPSMVLAPAQSVLNGASPARSAASSPPTAVAREGALDVSEEAELIARAHASLDAGATDETLRSLYLHERKFQHPRLSEEREILFVRTFAAAHRTTEARQRFARFTKAYPSSRAIPSLAILLGDD